MPRAFDRRATPRGGMHRQPNVAVIVKRSTKPWYFASRADRPGALASPSMSAAPATVVRRSPLPLIPAPIGGVEPDDPRCATVP